MIPTVISKQTYVLGIGPMTINSVDFTTNCTGIPMEYTATNYGTVLPSFITFNSTTKSFLVDSTSSSNIGFYTIQLTGSFVLLSVINNITANTSFILEV